MASLRLAFDAAAGAVGAVGAVGPVGPVGPAGAAAGAAGDARRETGDNFFLVRPTGEGGGANSVRLVCGPSTGFGGITWR